GWVNAAGITGGNLFRCVCRAGTAWGNNITEKVVWHVVKEYAQSSACPKSHRTTFADPVHACVTMREASWSRSNSRLATSQCRRQKNIPDASSVCGSGKRPDRYRTAP